MTDLRILKCTVFLAIIVLGLCQPESYYGLSLGHFPTVSHNLKGEVFAVDLNTVFVKGFSYDGLSSDAVFWAGSSELPDKNGFHIPNDISQFQSIPAFENQNLILNLPERSNIENIRWLAVWNRQESKSLGSLIFLGPIHPPQPMAIGPLVNTKHGVSTGDILILDTQTIMVPNFIYDGSGKEAYWLLSKGTKPNGDGILLLNHGRISPVAESTDNNLVLTLPDDHYVIDYDILSIWSKSEGDHYGYIDVPRNLNIPPSLRVVRLQEPKMEDFNCEMLNDNLGLEVRWFISGDDIIFHLIGNIASSEYMALGLSKDDTFSRFSAADAIVTGIDKNGKGFAVDYYFESDEKCNNGRGMCPDIVYGSQDNLQLLKVERVRVEERGNFTVIKFKRHLRTEDKVYDQVIYTDGPQAILWAVGTLDSDGFAESPALQSRGNILLDFGREPMWNCPPIKKVKEFLLEQETSTRETINRIHCPEDHLFRAQLGPSPHNISKKVWFINGIPTPEMVIQRGITYTFIIEGGLNPPYHHPFYITSSQEGGLYRNILEANEEVEVTYAGIQKDLITGTIFPTAEGRLCVWSQKSTDSEFLVVTSNREAKSALTLNCEPGEPGKLIWTPTAETPDDVYYQSYTERSLGGKIHVVDFCEETHAHRYLEIATVKGGKSKVNRPIKNDNLEREDESSEFESVAHTEKENFSIDEDRKHVERLAEDASPELINEKSTLNNDQNKIYNNVIIPSEIVPDKLTERLDLDEKQENFENETIANPFREIEVAEEVFPHDESERSDKYVSKQDNLRQFAIQNNAALNSHNNADDVSIKYPTHSASEASSISALGKPFSQEFKPQFEGGFIPLVTNPMKEKESVQKKEFVNLSHHQNRPRKPFLYNESVPFHGTFKPGIPDFSGFNISNYSQEDASIIINPISPENLALLAASKSKTVPRNFPPMGTIPLHLLDRPNDILPRPQRVQAFDPRFQRLQQRPSLIDVRKNIFPHLLVNGKPNFPIPNVQADDLASLPSQRVYVSMQATGDNKVGLLNTPNLSDSSYNRNIQNSHKSKMTYPPTIQRRPDFYEEKEGNLRPTNIPLRKFPPPQVFPNINNKQTIQQNNKISLVQSGALQPQANNRPKLPNPNFPINIQGNAERTISAQRPLRQPYPLINLPQRERIPQNPILLKPFHIRSNPLSFEKPKMNGGPLNHPHPSSKILPLPVHMLNQNEKTAETLKETQLLDSNPSKEQKPFPNLKIAESVEEPNVNNNPPIVAPTMNQEMKLPFNKTLGAFVLSTNLRSPQPISSVNFHQNTSLENNPNLSNLKDKSVIMNEDIPPMLNGGENNPIKSAVFTKDPQSPMNDRMQIVKEENDQSIKYQDPSKLHSHPASFIEAETEKHILEASPLEDFSSSKDSTFVEYEHEDNSENSDSAATDTDYLHYNVPFGARLKFPQNGSKIPTQSLNQTTKVSFGITRKSQPYPMHNLNRNSNGFIVSTSSTTSPTPTTRSATTVPSTISPATDAMIITKESESSNIFDERKAVAPEMDEKFKHLYYTPPFSTFHTNYQTSNSSVQDTQSSNEMKHIPIIADTLEGIIDPGYVGRKNIIFNINPNSSFPTFIMPPKMSEGINLPQISDNPPVNDNRTDYSILNHVLALIGGPPN